MVSDHVDLADVQGNILRGYRVQCVRHLILRVDDAGAARRWLGATAGDDRAVAPAVTFATPWGRHKPDACLNVGITFSGLRALRLPTAVLDSFPSPFALGMAARAGKLGDFGDSAPASWIEPFGDPERVHVVASIHADAPDRLDDVQRQIVASASGALRLTGSLDGARFDGDTVHFGYRDNISQPRFVGIHDRSQVDDPQPLAPIGTVLLGHPTAFEGVTWRVPQPVELGANGAFNAFRVLAQEVAAFESFLDRAARALSDDPRAEALLPAGAEVVVAPHGTRHDALREVVAARLCGRWRNGTPLELSPDAPSPSAPVSDSDFDFVDDDAGLRCPVGAHIRRCNPRGAKIVQRVANGTRRIVRRGMPYGPAFDRDHPDGIERGLLGNFVCADLAAQFESIQYDWLNLGLQHPSLTGSNDPLLGANDPEHSRFEIPTAAGTITLTGLPRLVRTRGGAYTFLPSRRALRHIGESPGG